MPKVQSKDPRVQAALDARRKRVAARKAEAAKKKQPAQKPAERTKGITNILKKRSTQAGRVFKTARGK
jgi:F0F1-type ATP synthase membrane subunit b/b'